MKSLKLLFAVVSLTLSSSYAQPVSQVFNSSGTWVVPAGYTANILVEAWGAGGAGGTKSSGAKGGGGGGAYVNSTFTNVPPGSYPVSVGAGGTGAGNSGGNSSFSYLSGVIAAGGSSTTNSTGGMGGSASSCTGDAIIAGTNGSNTSGNNGGAGGAGANGGGTGGAGGLANNGDGGNGVQAGGGGGGKAGPGNAGNSGNGAAGRVVITVLASSPLPVEMVLFKSNNVGNTIELIWETASEFNNEVFHVERSTDGKEYETIGTINGNGTTTEANEYRFFDENPLSGINYYRLKQVDYNGRFEFSPVITALFRLEEKIKVYPTIFQDELQVVLPKDASEEYTVIEIFSMQGALVYFQKQDGSGILNVALPPLATGQYMVVVMSGNKRSNTMVFKQ